MKSATVRRWSLLGVAIIASFGVAAVRSLTTPTLAAEPAPLTMDEEGRVRVEARKQKEAGNFDVAYNGFHKLLRNPNGDPKETARDLVAAVESLSQLGRISEVDELLEAAATAQAKQWRVLAAIANQYIALDHYGELIAGKFTRGGGQGGGESVSAADRDRVRALQLYQQAEPLAKTDADKAAVGTFYHDYARAVADFDSGREAWELQILTNLDVLPDYEPENRWQRRWMRQQNPRGAPVDANGNPVFYVIPAAGDQARNDGERWRWLNLQAKEFAPALVDETDFEWANFLHTQFGVQTLGTAGTSLVGIMSLGDDETYARLATGVKRFKLPDEFNPLKQFLILSQRDKNLWTGHAADMVAQTYEDRRQYEKAAAAWKQASDKFGEQHRLDRWKQIVGNWGEFQPESVAPAGQGVTLQLRYRNAKAATFTADALKVTQLLDDVKAYLKSSPKQLDWEQMNIGDLGYKIVTKDQQKYVGEQVATWKLDLPAVKEQQPSLVHSDQTIDVATPLQKAGAYLVTCQLADGNVSRIIVWVADTAIVKKPLDQQAWYYVADAVTGQPIEKANVEFFGWKQEQVVRNTNNYKVLTKEFAEFTNFDGQVLIGAQRAPQDHQWLVIARTPKGGLAYLGFNGLWYGRRHDAEYQQNKSYLITDRPVYRPAQTVKYKFWLQQAKYDQPQGSPFAGRKVTVELLNPEGESLMKQQIKCDEFGGIAGEWAIPKDAKLGQYHLHVEQVPGGGSFRVEEYKKPEYEVTIKAPNVPVRLGDKITATVEAKYYYGAPVTHARVKYKVERTTHSARWYPVGHWDWLYGRGYWWFSPNYTWYPGWRSWGCVAPLPWWWGTPSTPPELVAEQEVEIGDDGVVKIEIDTALAKELHGDEDHAYKITAEVVDASRRTVVGQGDVLVAREPFKVFAWVDRGHYAVNSTIRASFAAYTLDQQPVQGTGKLTLYRVTYKADGTPEETVVQTWDLNPDADGRAEQQIAASAAGQYRLSYVVTAAGDAGKSIEGGYLFTVIGQGFDGRDFRFNDLELITDKKEYAPGETVRLLINSNRLNGAVALFLRPTNGTYLPPKIIRLTGKSTLQEIAVAQKDMPNFYIEACTVHDGQAYQETREVFVPPSKQVVDVKVEPSQAEYLPGAPAKVVVKLTGPDGKPFTGSTVLSVYDRALDAIAGGSNIPDIRDFFWKWRRHHHPQQETSLSVMTQNLLKPGETPMSTIGAFGHEVMLADGIATNGVLRKSAMSFSRATPMAGLAMPASAPMEMDAGGMGGGGGGIGGGARGGAFADAEGGEVIQPTVRKSFADTAYWNAAITTDANGVATVEFPMPENLTAWKIKAWSLGLGARVGEGSADVVTKKNLLLRLQAPRFFVETDEVVLSAVIHNYLKVDKQVQAVLELDGMTLEAHGQQSAGVKIPAGGEQRVDWRVKAVREGTAVIRMKALTDVESDAMEQSFPVYVHGMLKTESFARSLRPNDASGSITFTVPEMRRINDSRIEVRYSPTLAGAMVDALPYLVDYPYGCTEQTLNRFLPTVVTQRILQRMQLDLKAIQEKRTNLNAQQIGDPKERAAQWKRFDSNPVFDVAEVETMVKTGVDTLTAMQLSDGGWGWFSGYGEHSSPHTTATVVHGLQVAKQNDIALVPGVLERGIDWLKRYQDREVLKLKNAEKKVEPWKSQADATDALVYGILIDADIASDDMRNFLFRDRIALPVYAKALFGIALHKQQQADQLTLILENIEQFLQQDDENQTAYLKLPEDNWWWYWYGSDIEANATYLKLLTRVNPQDARASRLVKYLLNNRRNSTYWNSTRDTALCIEAMAEYLVASGEDQPRQTVEVWLDGKKQNEVQITKENLFTFDNAFTLVGDAVTTGEHTLELRKQGTGPLYVNAYITTFTQESLIGKAGLEVKVQRQFYKLTRVDKSIAVSGSSGQVVDQKVEKFERTALENLAEVKSGDLIEVELEIDSKNDYEYVIFEDLKAAGCEPVDLRSGYTGNALGAYVEFRDERVAFFVRQLPRGKHSVSYRLRAEIPGTFSALPARAAAMYAPELRGNSDELKLQIAD